MPDVTKQITLSGGGVPRQVECWLKLVADPDQEAFGYTSTTSLGAADLYRPDNSGLVTFPGLVANDLITPAGTVYKITTVFPDATRIVEYIDVPDGAGPYDAADILTTVPSALPIPGAGNAVLGGDVTGTVAAALIAAKFAGYADPLTTIDDTFWTDATSVDAAAFDELSVVAGYVTVHTPSSGANNLAGDAAAHGARWHDFGSGFADNFEVEFSWSGVRPAEGTPLIHVVPGTTETGIGCWPGYDAIPGGAANSLWALGYIGDNNTNFTIVDFALLTAAELAEFTDLENPAGPTRIKLRSVGGTVTVYVNGRLIEGLSLTVPANLSGSTVHGFAVDNNQTDGNDGGGGTRPPDFPAGCGPFTIAPVVTSAAVPEALVSQRATTAAAADALSKLGGGTVNGPVRVVATTPTYTPGGVAPVVALYVEARDDAGAEIAHARFGDDGVGFGGFTIEQASGNTIGLGSLVGRPAAAWHHESDGTTTFAVLASDGSVTFTDYVTGTALKASGVNGATQGLRLVGKIATGTPTTGVVGDVVLVTDTQLWRMCTVAGTPGTWATIGSAGGVAGPGSSTDEHLVTWDGTGGDTVQDGGSSVADLLARANHTGTQTFSTLTGSGTVTFAGGGSLLMSAFGTIPIAGWRRSGDTFDRTQITSEGFTIGSGAATGDFSINRTGTATGSITGKLQQSTAPSTGDDLVNKTYVDGRTPAASTSTSGIVELATTAEVQAGTDTARAVTAAGVLAAQTQRRPIVTYPAASGQYFNMPVSNAGPISNMGGSGRLLLSLLWLPARTYDQVGVRSVGVGWATWRIGWYPLDSSGMPDWASAFDAGAIDMSSGTGALMMSISRTQTTAGWVWAGVLVDAYTSNPQPQYYGSSSNGSITVPGLDVRTTSNINAVGLWYSSVSTGAMPTSSPGTASTSEQAPRIIARTSN